jgi:hypothetical protein
MKRRLLRQLFLVLTLLVSQAGFAGGHPENSGSSTLNTTHPNSCTQTDKCFVFNYKGYQISTDGKNVTLSFSIKTNCAHDLSYAAFEIPAGSSATATGTSKFKYKTEITNNPFRSLKFEGSGINGYKNSEEDEFKYILSKANFDKLTTIRVQAKAATMVGTVTFDKNCSVPKCLVSDVALTNVIYTSAGVTHPVLQKVVQPGKPVKVCFTVPASAGIKTYSFVSYTAPLPYFAAADAFLQKVFSFKTIDVGPEGGTYCLEIDVPNCYFQIDFVKGCIIEKLGPAGSTNFYTPQGRLIAAGSGGTVPCEPEQDLECKVSNLALTNVTYTANGVTNASLQKVVQPGKPVEVCFTVPASAGYKTYSFVSYTSPNQSFTWEEAHLQKLFDYKTVKVGPDGGRFCLKINVPNCYFQVDFVRGCIIESFGPYATDPANFYGPQRRLIVAVNGGPVPCIPAETLGNEGCTPGYWKQVQHFGNWVPLVPVGLNATKFFDVFTTGDAAGNNCVYRGLSPDLTLLEALNLGGGDFKALARHAAAAYLNAKNPSVKYSISSNEIVDGVIKAFKTGNWSVIKDKLEKANEKGCPLGRSELTAATNARVAESPMNPSATPLSAFPNPFNNKAVVQFALKHAEAYDVSLYNMNGKQVRVLKTGAANAGERVQLTVDGTVLPEGLYLVRLVTKTETQTVKLVLKK